MNCRLFGMNASGYQQNGRQIADNILIDFYE